MKLTYIGSLDAVDVPLPTGGSTGLVARGEDVDVPDSYADRLLEQPTNWQPVKAKGPTVPDLKARLAAMGIEVPSGALKPELEKLLQDELDRQAAAREAVLTGAAGAPGDQTTTDDDSPRGEEGSS